MLGCAAVVVVGVGFALFRSGGDTAPEIGQATSTMNAPSVPVAASGTRADSAQGTKASDTPETGQSVTGLQSGAAGENADGSITSEQDKNVSATVIGDDIVASADADGGVKVEKTPLAKPAVGQGQSSAGLSAITLDLVRVDKAGAVVIAGKAPAGEKVTIQVDGETIVEVSADTHGAFVALFDLPPSTNPYVLTLLGTDAAGVETKSDKRIVIAAREVLEPNIATDAPAKLPTDTATASAATTTPAKLPTDTTTASTAATTPAKPSTDVKAASAEATPTTPAKPAADTAPAVIIASDEGVKVVQPASSGDQAPEVMDTVTLDLISYDTKGEVVLTGRSKPDQFVRVYVDDQPIKTKTVAQDGRWQLSLPEVDAVRYTLRVDEIDGAGQVTSRVETPFQQEQAKAVNRVASNGDLGASQATGNLPAIQKVTIQPGATLWALAEKNYGEGNLYMQIFNANKDFIRDPDLIYPGQIFTIPE